MILPIILIAQDNLTLFEEANAAYIAKEYAQAIEKYEQILNTGEVSSDLYYNLGNAYYKLDQKGKAILNYERGLMLSNNADLKYNLELARKGLEDEIEVLPPFFLSQWWAGVRQLASSKGWTIIALLMFWLGIAGLIVWQLAGQRKQKKLGFLAGLLLLAFSFFPFALAVHSMQLEADSGRAVVMSEEGNLRSGPDEVSTSIMLLHEGTLVEILDQIGDWYKVRLMNGEQGWLKVNVVEKI